MWYETSTFYQIYTLGFCDAPKENDGKIVSRIQKVTDWIPHLTKLGIDAIYFCPVFESDRHGYDTRDYRKIDCRLGSNDDFAKVCDNLHEAGIRVVLDGVFNHVGRGFFAFQDVIEKKWDSPYKDWFYINFDGNSGYNDGFWYEGWEGHFELVKLNLENPAVVDYLLESIRGWVDEFGIDGLRLDVAYCVNKDFLKRLRYFADHELGKEDFFLLGEVLFGDYNQIANDEMCHSVTNYECYKGLHSSFNSANLFELSHSLGRQFGTEQWCLYRGKHFLSFVDNHDVSRVASILKNENQLPLIFTCMFGMPGIPCIYYGSEWGAKGRKEDGDDALRLSYDAPEWNELTDLIARLISIRKEDPNLSFGSYRAAFLTNRQLVMARDYEGSTTFIGVNMEEGPYTVPADKFGAEQLTDLMTGETVNVSGGLTLSGYGMAILKK